MQGVGIVLGIVAVAPECFAYSSLPCDTVSLGNPCDFVIFAATDQLRDKTVTVAANYFTVVKVDQAWRDSLAPTQRTAAAFERRIPPQTL
jgi:hypothetical protein